MDTVRVAAGVISRGDLILVCRRRADRMHPLRWEFPGGKVEADESFLECLWRELREELGIDTRIHQQLIRTVHTYPNGVTVALAFYAVSIISGEPRNLDFAEIRWMPRGRLGELDFVEADREIVERLDRGE